MEWGVLGWGFGVVTGFLGFREVMWVMTVSDFCWVLTSQACNSERPCLRDAIWLFSMASKGMVLGNCFPKMSKEESSARKYMECEESVLGAQNITMVNFTRSDWSLISSYIHIGVVR